MIRVTEFHIFPDYDIVKDTILIISQNIIDRLPHILISFKLFLRNFIKHLYPQNVLQTAQML